MMKQHREMEGRTGDPPSAAVAGNISLSPAAMAGNISPSSAVPGNISLSPAAMAGNISLSQILVRREKRKAGGQDLMKGGAKSLGGNDGNSSVGEKASWSEEGGGCREGRGSELVDDVPEDAANTESSSCHWGGRETEAVWNKVMEWMKTANLTGQLTVKSCLFRNTTSSVSAHVVYIYTMLSFLTMLTVYNILILLCNFFPEFQHVDDIKVADHQLIDFDPHLPQFTMKRK